MANDRGVTEIVSIMADSSSVTEIVSIMTDNRGITEINSYGKKWNMTAINMN